MFKNSDFCTAYKTRLGLRAFIVRKSKDNNEFLIKHETAEGFSYDTFITRDDGVCIKNFCFQSINLYDLDIVGLWSDDDVKQQAITTTAVDLGLPSGTKWADCNVGATRPEEYGMYFAWGATEGADSDINDGKVFDWTTSPYSIEGEIPTVLDIEHDAATVNMGVPWRMPTKADFDELLANTTTEWSTLNGIYGRLVTSKINGATLFFPASGYRGGSNVYNIGIEGRYWAASLNISYTRDAHDLYFYFDDFFVHRHYYLCDGLSVRAVC